MTSTHAQSADTPAPNEVIRRALDDLEIEWEQRTAGRILVTMPGERKLRTECVLEIGPRAVDLHAFVMRHPEENHAEVYRFLLERNLRMRQVSFAVDHHGDIHLVGSLPIVLFGGEKLDGVGTVDASGASGDASAVGDASAPDDTSETDDTSDTGSLRAQVVRLLDGVLGEVLTASDSSFNRLLELGYAGALEREWAWRLARGESTRNLQAFRHLRPT